VQTVRLDIEGMTCATCSGRVEKVLRKVPGVLSASVNLATETAVIASTAEPAALIAAVERAGYGARPTSERTPDTAITRDRKESAQLVVAGLLAGALMLPMFGLPLNPWVQLALAVPAQALAWFRFGPPAWGALRSGTANMDTLVVLGTSAAFGLSLVMLPDALAMPGHAHLYFESAATITAFVLVGKWLEHRARHRAGEAVRALLDLRPPTAHLLGPHGETDVPAESVGVGQVVRIGPGERVPVDGDILLGRSALDESLLTGESAPVARGPGEPVIGGSVNGEGALEVRATATGSDAALARIAALVEGALASKAPVQRLVDQVAAVFVPVVIGFAVLVFVGWWLAGEPLADALQIAVAVLVVACPCALGLATPAALVAGMGSAARAGVFVRDADALDGLADTRTVAFDKTGTLTEGRPSIRTPFDADLLRLAAAVQRGSAHPLARAFVDAGPTELPAATELREQPGLGVEAVVEGRRVRLGSAVFLEGSASSALTEMARAQEEAGLTPVWVSVDGIPVAVVGLGDAIRPASAGVIASLTRSGIGSALVSGDRPAVAGIVARQLGITHVLAGLSPAEKVAALDSLPGPVAMVGDGVNDAPALAHARVGIAMGGGSHAAIASAPVTLVRSDPALVPAALDIARRTRAVIRQNLFWAFAYNVVALPLAAAGWLTPGLAAAAMALSSVTVVGNALRLRAWNPPSTLETA
jgi:Cu+-exporting ATPase